MTPPDDQTDDIAAILEEVDKVESVISTAQRLLTDGKMVDLSALEGKVKTLCERIADADLKDSNEVGNVLRAVLEKLEQLGDELVAQHDSIGGQTAGTPVKSAIDAYEKES